MPRNRRSRHRPRPAAPRKAAFVRVRRAGYVPKKLGGYRSLQVKDVLGRVRTVRRYRDGLAAPP